MAETDLRATAQHMNGWNHASIQTLCHFPGGDRPCDNPLHYFVPLSEVSAALAAVQQDAYEKAAQTVERTLESWHQGVGDLGKLAKKIRALSAPKAPRPEAASQSLRGDVEDWPGFEFEPPLWFRRGDEEWEPVYNGAVLMSYVLNAQRHGREFTVLRTQSPPSSVRPDAGMKDGLLRPLGPS